MKNNRFKPFDRVLVRDTEEQTWLPDFYSETSDYGGVVRYCTIGSGDCYRQCIPYEGNEHLALTTMAPESEWEPKVGDTYWFAIWIGSGKCVVDHCYYDAQYVDTDRQKCGNCFRSREAAQVLADRINEVIEETNKQAINELIFENHGSNQVH